MELPQEVEPNHDEDHEQVCDEELLSDLFDTSDEEAKQPLESG